MDVLQSLLLGFSVALTPTNIVMCFVGVLLGTLVGVLPGVGPVATIAMLLPITLNLSPVAALIMLAGIYYGAQYGGSTTAILVRLPGEASSVVTCLDGYQTAQKGRAGPHSPPLLLHPSSLDACRPWPSRFFRPRLPTSPCASSQPSTSP
jgi:putative tricarboxylic transport membrane protein